MNNYILIIIVYILVLAVMFYPAIHSNKKKKKEFTNMINSLQVNDKIITIGGIHGSISKILEATIEIKIDKGVTLTVSKEAISKVVK